MPPTFPTKGPIVYAGIVDRLHGFFEFLLIFFGLFVALMFAGGPTLLTAFFVATAHGTVFLWTTGGQWTSKTIFCSICAARSESCGVDTNLNL